MHLRLILFEDSSKIIVTVESQGIPQWLSWHVLYTSFYGFLQTKHAACFTFPKLFMPWTWWWNNMSSSNNSGRWNVSKLYCQLIVEPTKVETHLSIKLSKKNFGGILGPKSVRRTLVTGLIYGLRANKQFDIVFWVFWTLPGPIGHSDSLIFKPI